MSLSYALASDPGLQRENNEDHARAVPELGLFVVADGMGGHVAGEVASRVAVDALVLLVREYPVPKRIRDEQEILREAVLAANEAVLREAAARNLMGMGTTLTVVKVRSRTAIVSHVGDSRAYFVRASKLDPITTDHTMVAMMVAAGAIPPEDAEDHPDRHLLTQAVGTHPIVEPDIHLARIPRSARILLSTDGLHDYVPEEEIVEVASNPDLEQAVQDLVQAANDRGGADNVTTILIDP